VFDVFTALAVVFDNDGAAIGYTKEEAEDVAYLMNVQDRLRVPRLISLWAKIIA
jgi:hypothetical protein